MTTTGFIDDPNLTKASMFRMFVQEDGASPGNAFFYHGDLSLGGLTEGQGDITPIFAPSPVRHGQYIVVGYTRGEKSLPTSDITARLYNSMRQVWWDLRELGCPINFHVLVGDCDSPDDFNEWISKIIVNTAFLTNITFPLFNPFTGGEEAVGNITGSITALGISRFMPMNFEEVADTALLADVLDGFFGANVSCGNCPGGQDDGSKTFYSLQISDAASPGLAAQIVYTRDDFSTFVARNIQSLGVQSAKRIIKMGRYIVVFSAASNSHHILSFTNLHAGNTAAWVEVTGGYVATNTVNDVYSLSSNLAFISAENGYVYRVTNPTQSVQVETDGSLTSDDLDCIDGSGAVIGSGGENGAFIISKNKGLSWASKPVTVDAVTITKNFISIGFLDPYKWFLGCDDGTVYYTEDQGETYTLFNDLPNTITSVTSIEFVDSMVGYLTAVDSAAGAVVYRTDTMGNVWSNEVPYIDGVPAATTYNFAKGWGYNKTVLGGVNASADGVLAVGA